MAQRKSPPSGQPSGSRPAGSRAAAGKTSASKVSTSKPSAGKVPLSKPAAKPRGQKPPPVGRPAVRKPPGKGKSIVNQKQRPWGMIAATVAVVLFAVAIVVVVIVTKKSDDKNTAGGYTHPEIAAAKKIPGVIYKAEPQHTHKYGAIKYNTTPPTGGNHNPVWADCTGTVYDQPIANENAVHMLEHGAVWVTYNAKTLPASQVAELKRYVSGNDRMAMSPYPNLKTPISLQAWDYQLFVQKASDPRIAKFIAALKYNPLTTPEPSATCSDSQFIKTPSTFGHPLPTGA